MPTLEAGIETTRHKVVICGGGPVGLGLAIALARYNIPSLVVEADTDVCTGSRAICLSRRTMEILDRLGVLAPFLEKGLGWTTGRSYYRQSEILRFEMPHDQHQRLLPMTNLPQFYIEQFLVNRIGALSDLIELRWGTGVEGVTPLEDSVQVELKSGESRYKCETEWLIACDGARSTVRQQLGLKMRGTAYEGRYVIADIEIDLDLPTERFAWFDPPSNPGRTMLMHRQPDKVWRLDYQLHDGEDAEAMTRPENVVPCIEAHLAMIGQTAPWRLMWASSYRASALSLDDYVHGRVVFAGDAAHLVPIFGVRGLNSGLDDIFNLAWKISYVIGSRASADLLKSYSWERHLAWRTNITHAMKSTEFMAPPSRGFTLMRDAVLSLAGEHPQLRSLINPSAVQRDQLCRIIPRYVDFGRADICIRPGAGRRRSGMPAAECGWRDDVSHTRTGRRIHIDRHRGSRRNHKCSIDEGRDEPKRCDKDFADRIGTRRGARRASRFSRAVQKAVRRSDASGLSGSPGRPCLRALAVGEI